MSTLAELRDRVEQILSDITNAIYTTALIDECIRQCLHEYNNVSHQETEAVITLPGDGREVALNSLTGLLSVTDVWWPYDSTADEVWPPNRVRGWQLYWDNAQPLLIFTEYTGDQPQADDEVRVWYSLLHTIQDLDSASTTTIPGNHESEVCNGAAAKAGLSRILDLSETAGTDGYMMTLVDTWVDRLQNNWMSFLEGLRAQSSRTGLPWPRRGWKLDEWDSSYA